MRFIHKTPNYLMTLQSSVLKLYFSNQMTNDLPSFVFLFMNCFHQVTLNSKLKLFHLSNNLIYSHKIITGCNCLQSGRTIPSSKMLKDKLWKWRLTTLIQVLPILNIMTRIRSPHLIISVSRWHSVWWGWEERPEGMLS